MELDDQLEKKMTEIFSGKLQKFQYDNKQNWIDVNIEPKNISGRQYQGFYNKFFLSVNDEVHGYKYPFYLTPKQAKELELDFRGAKCVPVFYTKYIVVPKSEFGKPIDYQSFLDLPQKDGTNYEVDTLTGYNQVMNIQQTDFALKYPEKLEELLKSPNYNHAYSFEPLDSLIEKNTWLCPIKEDYYNEALYAPREDYIQIPSRKQFKDITSFYSTLLHEMTHSTGISTRLNRPCFMDSFNRRQNEAKEELVAELGAVIVGIKYGITREIPEENFGYVQDWLGALNNDPKFIAHCMKDAMIAANFINKHIEKLAQQQEMQIGSPAKAMDERIADNIRAALVANKAPRTPKTLKLKI